MTSGVSGNPMKTLYKASLPISSSKKAQNQLMLDIERGVTSSLTQSLMLPLESLTLADLGLENPAQYFQPGLITLINMHSQKQLWIGMFCMSRGTSFPLHDHPDMIGITRLFTGSLVYRSLDITSSTNGICEATLLSQGSASDPTTFQLTPNKGNIHEIVATEDSVMLNLFLPNYSKSRRCTYFEDVGNQDGNVILRQIRQPNIPCQERPYIGLPLE